MTLGEEHDRMKKVFYVTTTIFIFLLFCTSYSNHYFASEVGTQGDLTFVEDSDYKNDQDKDKDDEDNASHNEAESGFSKPNGSSMYPKTGDEKKLIWIVIGMLFLIISILLIIDKKKSRRMF